MAGELERYRAAREAFSKYADMNSPELPDDELSAIQVRLARWRIANFGTNSTNQNMLGATEEMGEQFEEMILLLAQGAAMGRLAKAILKHEQQIRGYEDKEFARAKMADAIMDNMVFLMQMCTEQRIDFGTLFREVTGYVLNRDWVNNPQNGDVDGVDG